MDDSGAATIVIARTPAYSAGAVVFIVRIDGAEACRIRPNDRIRLRIPPGDHRIQVTMWSRQGSRTLDFRAAPGQVIGFVCQGTMKPLHPIDLVQDDAVVSEPAAGMPYSPPFHAPSAPPRGQVRVEVVETGQFEEPLGEEVRVIDNRDSATGVTRSVKASREWTRTVSIETEHVRTFGAELGGGPAWLRVKGSVEDELHRTYSTEGQTTRVFAEEITITVPAHTSVRLALRWKRIWQRGVVRVTQPDGTSHEVPYQVIVNVTFDQSQQDAPARPTDADATTRLYWTPPNPDRPTI